jgi:hypothetical protein
MEVCKFRGPDTRACIGPFQAHMYWNPPPNLPSKWNLNYQPIGGRIHACALIVCQSRWCDEITYEYTVWMKWYHIQNAVPLWNCGTFLFFKKKKFSPSHLTAHVAYLCISLNKYPSYWIIGRGAVLSEVSDYTVNDKGSYCASINL